MSELRGEPADQLVERTASGPWALEVTGAVKRFGGIHALNGVEFRVMPGEIHGLVGENGAGKTTLVRIVAGLLHPDEGTVFIRGEPVVSNVGAARKSGVGMVHQELSLVPTLTVAENIGLGSIPHRFGFVRQAAMERIAKHALNRVGCTHVSPSTLVSRLTIAERQLVEIARVLEMQPAVVILDEPTSSLTSEETRRLFSYLRGVAASGTAIVYVSHRLEEIYDICSTATILRDGQLVARVRLADTPTEELIRLMVGHMILESATGARTLGGVLLAVDRLVTDKLTNVSLQARAGEIVGLAGLVGAGRTELARAIFGLEPIRSGSIVVGGQKQRITSPRMAIGAGVAYLPEDRTREGLARELSVGFNLSIAALRDWSPWGILDRHEIAEETRQLVDRLAVIPPDVDREVSTLSGGNQQKVVLGKWLATKPILVILDEPTRGIDVGAKSAIREQIRLLAETGVAILLISSELPELLDLCDRIHVMRGGTIVGEVGRGEFDAEDILSLCCQGKPVSC